MRGDLQGTLQPGPGMCAAGVWQRIRSRPLSFRPQAEGRSGGIWPRMWRTSHSRPDVSTAPKKIGFAGNSTNDPKYGKYRELQTRYIGSLFSSRHQPRSGFATRHDRVPSSRIFPDRHEPCHWIATAPPRGRQIPFAQRVLSSRWAGRDVSHEPVREFAKKIKNLLYEGRVTQVY
jgi:hypothetical protein